MLRRTWPLALALAALVGCDSTEPEAPTATPPAGTEGAPAIPPAETETAPEAAADSDTIDIQAVSLSEDEIANIKKLDEADAEAALKQKVCPVSGEHLGAMEKPIKVEADGKTAYLCCEGCKTEFDEDPSAVLAKLGLDKE